MRPVVWRAVAVVEDDAALEDVGVVRVVRPGGIGPRHVQDVAQLGEEELVVGALGGRRAQPAVDESLDSSFCAAAVVARYETAITHALVNASIGPEGQ